MVLNVFRQDFFLNVYLNLTWFGKNQNRVRAGRGDANDVDDGDTGGGGAVAGDDGGDSD